MNYKKYHALGNDYIVIRPKEIKAELTKELIRLICHRNYGIGSDGILYGPLSSDACDFGLKIFNPDGSEAEKSGNGLRIFARSLCDDTLTNSNSFTVETLGGNVGQVYTLASGSSSTAAAAVALKLGHCDSNITVHMPGGQIQIKFDKNFMATMTGSVTKVCDGDISQEMFTIIS